MRLDTDTPADPQAGVGARNEVEARSEGVADPHKLDRLRHRKIGGLRPGTGGEDGRGAEEKALEIHFRPPVQVARAGVSALRPGLGQRSRGTPPLVLSGRTAAADPAACGDTIHPPRLRNSRRFAAVGFPHPCCTIATKPAVPRAKSKAPPNAEAVS